MLIEKLVVPTPFPVGPINLYLILDDPLTLIDTGPKTDEAYAALRSEFARVGSSISSSRPDYSDAYTRRSLWAGSAAPARVRSERPCT